MVGTNQIYPVATAPGARVLAPASWQASSIRQNGFGSGIVPSPEFNTAYRQSSFVAAMIGQFIADLGYDAFDNGDLAGLTTNYKRALSAAIGAAVPSSSLVHAGPDTSSTANVITIPSVTPAVDALTDYQLYEIIPNVSNTDATTVKIGTFAALPLQRRDGTAVKAGDCPSAQPFLAIKYGGAFRMVADVSVLAAVASNPSISPPRNLVSYTTGGTYTFTVPANITWIFVEVVGGGGGGHGGGGGVSWAGGGGGSGGYAAGWIAVTPGQAFTVLVGAGAVGSDNSSDTVAPSGGTSAFGSSLQATGGGGGRGGPSGANGGTPGVGSGGQKNFYGANGGDGNPYRNDSQGGNGASSAFGGGGRTATLNNPVMNGLAPGSGGGGIWYTAAAQMGGNGAPGAVIVQY